MAESTTSSKRRPETVEFVVHSVLILIALFFFLLHWALPYYECSSTYNPCKAPYTCDTTQGMCNCYSSNFTYIARPPFCDELAQAPVPWSFWVGFAFLLLNIPANAFIWYWLEPPPHPEHHGKHSEERFGSIEQRLVVIEEELKIIPPAIVTGGRKSSKKYYS